MIITKINDYPAPIITSGDHIQEIIGLEAGDAKSHSLARVTIKPGKASAPHFHKISDESYFILSGTATMNIDGVEFSLQQGEAVLIEPLEVHQIHNFGDDDLVFLAVCVPAWHPDDSFEMDESTEKTTGQILS